jgi:SAM-dependent methyltransferase
MNKNTQAAHWKGKSYQIVDSYFTSPPATKRSLWLCDQLKAMEFKSVLEVGSFAGRNLFYLQQAFPNAELTGLEINPTAVRYAREKVPKASFVESDLHDLDAMNGAYDLVFTSGVLIHIPPADLKGVLEKLDRKSTRYLIHLEELGPSELVACPDPSQRPKKKVSDQWQWNVDLVRLYQELGYQCEVIELPAETRTNGARELVVVRL